MAAINSMAVEMMRDVSRYAKVPSAKCLKGIHSPPTKAPATAPRIIEIDTGSLKRRFERRNTPSMDNRHISSISKVPSLEDSFKCAYSIFRAIDKSNWDVVG